MVREVSGNPGSTPYILSKDWERLYELLCAGYTIAAFVDFQYPDGCVVQHICTIRRESPFQIFIHGYGIDYGSVRPFDEGQFDTELAALSRSCTHAHLQWIVPAAPLPIIPIQESLS